MILFKYIAREITLTTLGVSSLLVLVFLSNVFVRYLNAVALGRYSVNFLLQMMLLEFPYLLSLLSPLGLYLSILLVLGRMHADSEITVLIAGGVSKRKLGRYIISIACVVSMLVGYLVFLLCPNILASRATLRVKATSEAMIDMLVPGRFQRFQGGKRVIYAQEITNEHNAAYDLFFASIATKKETNIKYWDILLTEKAQVQKKPETDEKYVVLSSGHRYKGIPGKKDFEVIFFDKIALEVPKPAMDAVLLEARALPTATLVKFRSDPAYQAELQWRLAMPLTVLILSLLAVALSEIRLRQGKYASILPGAVFYIIYANLLFMGRDWIKLQVVPFWIGLWWIHFLFIMATVLISSKAQILRWIRNYK